jgi:hypothetical protein
MLCALRSLLLPPPINDGKLQCCCIWMNRTVTAAATGNLPPSTTRRVVQMTRIRGAIHPVTMLTIMALPWLHGNDVHCIRNEFCRAC